MPYIRLTNRRRFCQAHACGGPSGIDTVRNKIKMFAQKKVTLPPGRHKIVILDEADRCGLAVRCANRLCLFL